MKLKPFELERYFSKYEFRVSHLLSCSDCEPYSLSDLLVGADDETLAMWENLKLSYTESQGNPVLINEISKLYKTITHDKILQVIPEEGIYITMRTLISEGDEVISMFPCYQSLEEIAVSQGAVLKRWKAKYKSGWTFDIDELDNMCTPKTHMVIINIPHNPTGAVFTNDESERIVNIARKNNCILFCDEMYRFLEFNKSARLPSTCEIYDNAISLCGLSKSFAMPGLRCGWLITKTKKYLTEFKVYKDYTTICSSAPSEILSIMALKQKDKILKRNMDIISLNLKALDEFAAKYKSIITYKKPAAGSICMPLLNPVINADTLAEKLIDEISLMVLPSSVYNLSENAFRIGFGRKDFISSLTLLDNYMEKYLQKRGIK